MESKNNSILMNASRSSVLFSHYPHGYEDREGIPVPNNRSDGSWTVLQAYAYVTSEKAKGITQELRRMVDFRLAHPEEQDIENREKNYKMLRFEQVTFGGLFRYRRTQDLSRPSGLITIDIDGLASLEEARTVQQILIQDTWLETALCFVSPRGRGVKWVVTIPPSEKKQTFRDVFDAIYNHLVFEYGIVADTSGSDISRSCFLPWDEHCYINPKFLSE